MASKDTGAGAAAAKAPAGRQGREAAAGAGKPAAQTKEPTEGKAPRRKNAGAGRKS